MATCSSLCKICGHILPPVNIQYLRWGSGTLCLYRLHLLDSYCCFFSLTRWSSTNLSDRHTLTSVHCSVLLGVKTTRWFETLTRVEINWTLTWWLLSLLWCRLEHCCKSLVLFIQPLKFSKIYKRIIKQDQRELFVQKSDGSFQVSLQPLNKPLIYEHHQLHWH